MSCSMQGCSNCRRLNTEGVSFYTFPRGELQKIWLKVCGQNEQSWTWSKNKVVCSKHFRSEDFVQKGAKKFIKSDAVPLMEAGRAGPSESFNETTLSTIIDTSTSQSNFSVSFTDSGKQRTLKRKLSLSRKSSESTELHNATSSTSTSEPQSVSSGTKRRKIEFIKSTHNYNISPRKLMKKNINISNRQGAYRKKLYEAKRKITTLKQKVSCLKSVVADLQKQNFLSSDAVQHLEMSCESVPRLLMSRYLKNIRNKTTTHENYPPLLREFASTLQFYSCKAYEYVRKEFALSLPHQSTIRKWCSNVECLPGFVQPSFEVLKTKVDEAATNGRNIICSLLIDEMAIKKQIDFDGKKTWGYIDIGVPTEADLQPATEAFVVMVVSHQSHWKIPIAYFLIKALNGKEKANIIIESLTRLFYIGVQVVSVTCDGPSANVTMIKELGCDLSDVHNMVTWFTHPCDVEQKVFCMLDACHMLKLCRNHLATLKQIRDPQGAIISWNYIKELHHLQENESLNIANKLKKSHWYKQKMKVNLAAQTLSRSVADALQFVCQELKLPKFGGCEATINFIRKINSLFDILNSRSPWAKEFQAPLKIENEAIWRPFILETIKYLLYCTDIAGIPLWKTPRKTPIIGFVISAISVCGIFDQAVKPGKLNYLLTYKCSQDHLEIFFCSIRSRNGWNNNPTALQFMRTFKKLLLRSSISGRGGNCTVMDTTTVLTIPSTTHQQQSIFDVSLYRKYNLDIFDNTIHDHDYDLIHNFIGLTEVSNNIVAYISGFVLKTLRKRNKCVFCVEGCITTMLEVGDISAYKLLFSKNRGGRYIPAQGVITICTRVETLIRKIVHHTENKLPQEKDFFEYFVTAVAQFFYSKIFQLFPSLNQHFFENVLVEENHGYILVKDIIYTYTKIRFFNLSKRYTTIIQGKLVRRQLNKLILFHHQ